MYTDSSTHFSRRTILKVGAGHLLMATGLLGGCAAKPATPPPPPKPIGLLAVLPVLNPSEKPEYSDASIAPDTQGGIAIIAIKHAFSEYRRKQRNEEFEVYKAFEAIGFDAAKYMTPMLAPVLQQRGVKIVQIEDPKVADEVWEGEYSRLPQGVDAILAVEVSEIGFSKSLRTGGLVPTFGLSATLRPANATQPDLETFAYYFDWRDSGGDPRWVTSPKAMIYPSIDALKNAGMQAKKQYEEAANQLLKLVVEDIHRRVMGQLRVD